MTSESLQRGSQKSCEMSDILTSQVDLYSDLAELCVKVSTFYTSRKTWPMGRDWCRRPNKPLTAEVCYTSSDTCYESLI
jgi:hypothetical protein